MNSSLHCVSASRKIVACGLTLVFALAAVAFAEPGTDSSKKLEPGPNGSVKAGNKICPMMNKPVKPDKGFVYNGWWIGICCNMCDKKFAANVDKFAEMILKETGHDVRKAPQAPSDAPKPVIRFAGPNGTLRLDNAKCPVKGLTAKADVGAEYNGWWINFFDKAAADSFAKEPEKYLAKIKDATKVDVSQKAARDAGPNGTRLVGNPVDPVDGKKADPKFGVAHNGWWIYLSSAANAEKFAKDADKLAEKLKEQYGVDIKQAPAGGDGHGDGHDHDHGDGHDHGH